MQGTRVRLKIPFLYDYVFPNLVLPNALITEFGIINYLHTLYSNRLRENSFFDNQAGDQNPTTLIFDDKLGSWPNSLRTGGCHLNSAFYEKYLEYQENSLYFGKKQCQKYVYPIKITPHIDNFIGVNLGEGNKLNGEYFWKHMSAEALEDAQCGNALIFLDYAQENFVEKLSYINFHEAIRCSGIPKSQIILAFNSFNAKEMYESWFTPEERRLEVHNWPFVIAATSFHFCQNADKRLSESSFIETENTHRHNYFLFKIRSPREHRLALMHKMASDQLLEKGDWSCLTPLRYRESRVQYLAEKYKFEVNLSVIEELYKLLPHSLQNEQNSTHSSISAWTDQNADAHKNSYFYICSETYVHGEHKSLTEKVFKPIINFQPFLFVAYPGALQMLRDLGFKTFNGYIDESYDAELDEVKRMQMIYAEITRLCSMSKEAIHEWFWSMKEILIHNHRHLLEIHKHEPKAPELIKYLYQRINN